MLAETSRIVSLIDQDLRQRVGIELDEPGAVGRRAHKYVRHDRLERRRTEGEPRLRIELADFRNHLGQIFVADAAYLFQGGKFAPRQEIEPRDQRLHGGIETIEFRKLNREAFGEIAREYAGRIERLQDAEHRLDLGDAGAEFFGRSIEVAREISGIVDQIDEVLSDHAPPGIEDGERKLLAQHVRQGGFGGDKRFQIVVAVLAASRSDAGPVRVGARKVGIAARAGRFGVIPRRCRTKGADGRRGQGCPRRRLRPRPRHS